MYTWTPKFPGKLIISNLPLYNHYIDHYWILYKTLCGSLGVQFRWYRMCLACTKPWILSLALYKPGEVAHSCNSSIWEVVARASDVEGTSLGYMVSQGQPGLYETLSQKTKQAKNHHHPQTPIKVAPLYMCLQILSSPTLLVPSSRKVLAFPYSATEVSPWDSPLYLDMEPP